MVQFVDRMVGEGPTESKLWGGSPENTWEKSIQAEEQPVQRP